MAITQQEAIKKLANSHSNMLCGICLDLSLEKLCFLAKSVFSWVHCDHVPELCILLNPFRDGVGCRVELLLKRPELRPGEPRDHSPDFVLAGSTTMLEEAEFQFGLREHGTEFPRRIFDIQEEEEKGDCTKNAHITERTKIGGVWLFRLERYQVYLTRIYREDKERKLLATAP